uniref:Uncharacterized protein n=1 Tax=Firmicutes phage HS18 TaxID=3056396 RepID=A0AA50AF68_9VIRU|nr:MAG: hypothetical protein [Firmicutes phage HS18]
MQEKILYIVILIQIITTAIQSYNIKLLRKEIEELKNDK